VIVGAGPAGLAAAASLRARGVDATIVERGDRIGEPWRGRYDRLHLHTIRWLSGLPGYGIPSEFGRWVSRDAFVEYLERYTAHHRLEPRLGVEATSIDRSGGGWRVSTRDGALDARAVVVATGMSRVPYLPAWPGSFDGPLAHASDYRNPEPFRGHDVLVVGAGNTGAEIAVDLVEGGASRVRVAVRTPPVIVRRDTKGFPTQLLGIATKRVPAPVMDPVARALRRVTVPDLRPHGLPSPVAPYSQVMRTGTIPVVDVGFVDAVRSGAVEVVAAVEAFDGGGVQLADGSRVEPDSVVAATGYRPGLEPLVGHLGVIGAHGLPRALPGLHFPGMTILLSGLLREIARDGRRIAATVERELRERAPDAAPATGT